MAKREFPKWLGNTILHPDDVSELERNSAHFEFSERLPRQEAEKKAYAEYTRKHLIKAAAHHTVAAKKALAGGDHHLARKHAVMASLHNAGLGGDEVGSTHPEVQNHIETSPKKPGRFHSAPGDAFLVTPSEPTKK